MLKLNEMLRIFLTIHFAEKHTVVFLNFVQNNALVKKTYFTFISVN